MPLADFGADLGEIMEDFPSMLTFGSVSLSCIEGDKVNEIDITLEGDYNPIRKDVVCFRDDFHGSIPDIKNVVTLDSVQYYVEDVEDDVHTKTVRLTLRRLGSE